MFTGFLNLLAGLFITGSLLVDQPPPSPCFRLENFSCTVSGCTCPNIPDQCSCYLAKCTNIPNTPGPVLGCDLVPRAVPTDINGMTSFTTMTVYCGFFGDCQSALDGLIGGACSTYLDCWAVATGPRRCLTTFDILTGVSCCTSPSPQ